MLIQIRVYDFFCRGNTGDMIIVKYIYITISDNTILNILYKMRLDFQVLTIKRYGYGYA